MMPQNEISLQLHFGAVHES